MYCRDLTVRRQQDRSTYWKFKYGASIRDAPESSLREKDNCETAFAIERSMSQMFESFLSGLIEFLGSPSPRGSAVDIRYVNSLNSVG
jgi:hypothetical protein